MQAVYVDTSDCSNLEVPFNTRPWGQSVVTDIFPRFDDGGRFAMLQAFMEKYFAQRHGQNNHGLHVSTQRKDMEGETHLTLSVLKLCEMLLRFGSYSSNDEIAHIAYYICEALRKPGHDDDGGDGEDGDPDPNPKCKPNP